MKTNKERLALHSRDWDIESWLFLWRNLESTPVIVLYLDLLRCQWWKINIVKDSNMWVIEQRAAKKKVIHFSEEWLDLTLRIVTVLRVTKKQRSALHSGLIREELGLVYFVCLATWLQWSGLVPTGKDCGAANLNMVEIRLQNRICFSFQPHCETAELSCVVSCKRLWYPKKLWWRKEHWFQDFRIH